MSDPNIHVPMNMVTRILISQVSSCPICLTDVPVSPRMLRCGHIFCYSCLLRFLSSEPAMAASNSSVHRLTLKSHKECPLCFDVVDINKTKPVTFSLHDERFEVPREGEDALLRLMVRPHGSIMAVPANSLLAPSEFETIPWYYSPGASEHARIMQGTVDYMLSEYEREIREIKNTMIEDELMFGDAGYYAKLAISKIHEAMKMINTTLSNDNYNGNKDKNSSSDDNDITSDAYNTCDLNETSILAADLESVSLDNTPELSYNTTETLGNSMGSVEVGSLYNDSTAYFFYQTSFNSVIRYFLAPLDINILRSAFGFYSSCPSVLLVKILNVVHSEVVTLDLQKRSKYLAHLPVGTEIAFVECDWSGVISDEVLKPFSEVLRERKKKKKQKERREERDFQRARAEEVAQRDELLRESGYELSVYERLYSQTMPSSKSAKQSGTMVVMVPRPTSVLESTSEIESGSSSSRRTVWGTSAVGDAPEPILDPIQRQLDLAASQDHDGASNGKAQKKKSKKMVLVSSGGKRLF
ncbi:hypothetical protein NADFUDRAFT_84109 [Nadsonia fulvescens var. elongata DSM 6958]|uniref:RING-type domain-containing protein n=1 Tax=Nadsonia fulvescens var. elongata DSM 6958 TaxID=857566 RepID=A0A1E3PFD2_9ASCO|nr:hypothetical protein NADFUDRAFT_84109 [Nadsonia fulvescens var. elongata DSM 6958]